MTTWLALLAFPLIWPWIAKYIWNRELSWLEVGVNVGGVSLLVTLIYVAGSAGQVWDTEIWNGEVTAKNWEKVSCEHSYDCNCREVTSCSGSGKNRSCSSQRVCDTCYEHSYDVSWRVNTNLGAYTIQRINRQGTQEPPRWSSVRKGDPVAQPHTFINYVKGAPESIFHLNPDLDSMKSMVPNYPKDVFDYYRLNRVFATGINVPELDKWNEELSLMLRKLGPQKQANIIIQFVNSHSPTYQYALESTWLGGKKNDIVVIFGTPNYPEIEWVRIVSWTKEELFKVKLRDALQDLKTVDRNRVFGIIDEATMKYFKRREMKDFEYLKYEIEPPEWLIIVCAVLGALGSIGVSIWLSRPGVDLGR